MRNYATFSSCDNIILDGSKIEGDRDVSGLLDVTTATLTLRLRIFNDMKEELLKQLGTAMASLSMRWHTQLQDVKAVAPEAGLRLIIEDEALAGVCKYLDVKAVLNATVAGQEGNRSGSAIMEHLKATSQISKMKILADMMTSRVEEDAKFSVPGVSADGVSWSREDLMLRVRLVEHAMLVVQLTSFVASGTQTLIV